ncbi:hypothetical protein L6164_009054 [Bauhinia variegata]|uniref:Uncharacterized protein n=1 Tax=Bauhinia variegata TaxID=167791 RepID=A0ACB9PK01_BAUVA|nr:hypothetical protein L6164_009054 [Bauhinia variegata]
MQPWNFKSFNHPTARRKHRSASDYSGKPPLTSVLIGGLVTTTLVLALYSWTSNKGICSKGRPLNRNEAKIATEFDEMASPLVAILNYATSSVAAQQSRAEIRVAFDVLQSLAPCNFLVFGIGYDSLMWDSLNPRGTTVFLEEDAEWARSVLLRYPVLRAYTVRYPTRMSEADGLLSSYKKECRTSPSARASLKANTQCKLALNNLPDEVYDRDWDVIMIDGPKGYFAAAPGRMAVIYSAAIIARTRRRSGVTHVFLHDVDRKVEKLYAKEFLCMKNRVSAVGKLWHFAIPPALDLNESLSDLCK